MELVLGIDGGGTNCRAALADGKGVVLGRGSSGAANITTDLSGAHESIVEAAWAAFRDAGRDPAQIAEAGAVLGLAGTNVGSYKQRLAAILPFAASLIESDALIALEGAIGGHDGAIAILGTGSAYLARQAGVLRPLGGWGFVVGDLGSGARLGRALLEATLLAYDRIRPATALTEAVLARFGGEPGAVVDYAVAAKPRDFGAFAPLVFEFAGAGDALADALIRQSVADVEATFDAINLRPTDWLCTLGGLAEPLSARFSARYKALLRPPLKDALGGAVQMAVARFGQIAGS